MDTSLVRFLRFRQLCSVAVLTLLAGGWLATPSGVSASQDPAPNPNVERLLKTRECRGCDFTSTEIVNKDLSGVDLTNASFEGGSLYACNLTGANLTGVNFRDAVLRRSDLNNATLAGTDFNGADLSFAMNANLQAAGTTPTTTCPDLSTGPCR
jgi:uncharacterized protein YjbI with pentapeptide repeats